MDTTTLIHLVLESKLKFDHLKEWDKRLILMNFELNQMVGLGECDQSQFSSVLVQQHMSVMLRLKFKI